ncbi:MAG: hypothetical protein H6923_02210 [Alphaproteobacteria bacterium]|nr:hypothetical protein [Alphaproteobacteria bacterium]
MVLLYNDCEVRRGAFFLRSTRTLVPITPALVKDLARMITLYVVVSCVWLVRRPTKLFRPLSIGFFPHRPGPWYLIWNVMTFLGARAAKDPRDCDVLYYFEDATQAKANLDRLIEENRHVVNLRCTDIGKDRVAATFERVFGYPLSVDPRSHVGPAVRKSVQNAAHDGTVVACPLADVPEGVVFQRLIDNAPDGAHVQDIRVPIIGETIPFAYIKERPLEIRFANENSRVSFHETAELLSAGEVEKILAFAREMHLEVGSCDVLRDRVSGRIYIVDANKTCMGPPVALPLYDKLRALNRLARTFEAYVTGIAQRQGGAREGAPREGPSGR